jgi:hypothetical protein
MSGFQSPESYRGKQPENDLLAILAGQIKQRKEMDVIEQKILSDTQKTKELSLKLTADMQRAFPQLEEKNIQNIVSQIVFHGRATIRSSDFDTWLNGFETTEDKTVELAEIREKFKGLGFTITARYLSYGGFSRAGFEIVLPKDNNVI